MFKIRFWLAEKLRWLEGKINPLNFDIPDWADEEPTPPKVEANMEER